MSEAERIYQANLNVVSDALMAGDLCAALEHIAIPNLMSTNDREIVMASPEEFDLVMQDFRAKLIEMGITRYTRRCLEADFVPGMTDMIAGRHETRMSYADGRLYPPFPSRMVLMRYGTAWKGIWLQTEMNSSEVEILSPDIAAAQADARRALEKGRRS